MAHKNPVVLILDDDPSHLQIYSWIVERGGFDPVSALVAGDSVALPVDQPVDVAVIDYCLTGRLTAVEVAQQLRRAFPTIPLIVLSDLFDMPIDISAYARHFVRKGDPEKLLHTIALTLAEGCERSTPPPAALSA